MDLVASVKGKTLKAKLFSYFVSQKYKQKKSKMIIKILC